MARTESHPNPSAENRKSVLSDKDAVQGLPKSDKRSERHEKESCESVLDGPECIDGSSGEKKKRRS